MRRVFHSVAVHFKGSGFYTSDYGKDKPKSADESKPTSNSDGSPKGSSDSSSESSKSDSSESSKSDRSGSKSNAGASDSKPSKSGSSQ